MLLGWLQVRANSLEVAAIATRLEDTDAEMRVERARADELQRRLSVAEAAGLEGVKHGTRRSREEFILRGAWGRRCSYTARTRPPCAAPVAN